MSSVGKRSAPHREDWRLTARRLFDVAVKAADPSRAVRRSLTAVPLPFAGFAVLAIGKAAEGMLEGLMGSLSFAEPAPIWSIPRALVVYPENMPEHDDRAVYHPAVREANEVTNCFGIASLERVPAQHPVPGAGSLAAGLAVERFLVETAGLPLVVLLSGGASSLVCTPVAGVSLEQKAATAEILLRSGADIGELNCVRQHLSGLKGGGMARVRWKAWRDLAGSAVDCGSMKHDSPPPTEVLVLSDVIGDELSIIAGGPFTGKKTDARAALAVLAKYRLMGAAQSARAVVALSVVERLQAAALEDVDEEMRWFDESTEERSRRSVIRSVAPEADCFAAVQHRVVGSNAMSVAAIAKRARELGFEVEVAERPLSGEARQVGFALASLAGRRDAEGSRSPAEPPTRSAVPDERPPRLLVGGGETTVAVRGSGTGGRCQELALAFAVGLAEKTKLDPLALPRDWVLMAAGTDGRDGPTAAAGAIVDEGTLARIAAAGRRAEGLLADNDSNTALTLSGDLLVVGPTGTNVGDVVILVD